MAFRPRRVWIAVATFGVVFVGTIVLGSFLPDQYRSESVIQVVPQRVPESLVRSTITQNIDERLPAIQQQILSRTRLERIIQDFGLYQEERKTGLMEDIVAGMRDNIQVNIVKGDAFLVSYVSDNARIAMKVTERLASMFVEENLRDREVLAEGANQFLDSQLDDARRRLLDHEKKLEEFRRQYSGELPEQLSGTLQSIQGMQNQLTALSESLNRDRDRKLVLERQLVELEYDSDATSAAATQSVVAMPTQGTGDAPPPKGPAAADLEFARSQLTAMLMHMMPQDPDVQQMRRTIAELEKKVEAARAELATNVVAARIRDRKNEIDGIEKLAAVREDSQKRLQRMIADYQQRANATPTREADLIALNRDYDTLSKIYTTLLSKSEEAKVAANLERRQIGQQFKVLDAARLPERPFSPNRPLINATGFIGGLLLSLAVMAFLNYRDRASVSEQLTERLGVGMPATSLLGSTQLRNSWQAADVRRVSFLCAAGLQAVLMTTVVLFQLSYARSYGFYLEPPPASSPALFLTAIVALGYVVLLEAACGVVVGLNEAFPSRQFVRGSIAGALGSIVALVLILVATASLEAGATPLPEGERGQLPPLLPLVAPLLGVVLSPVAGISSVITRWARGRWRPPSV